MFSFLPSSVVHLPLLHLHINYQSMMNALLFSVEANGVLPSRSTCLSRHQDTARRQAQVHHDSTRGHPRVRRTAGRPDIVPNTPCPSTHQHISHGTSRHTRLHESSCLGMQRAVTAPTRGRFISRSGNGVKQAEQCGSCHVKVNATSDPMSSSISSDKWPAIHHPQRHPRLRQACCEGRVDDGLCSLPPGIIVSGGSRMLQDRQLALTDAIVAHREPIAAFGTTPISSSIDHTSYHIVAVAPGRGCSSRRDAKRQAQDRQRRRPDAIRRPVCNPHSLA